MEFLSKLFGRMTLSSLLWEKPNIHSKDTHQGHHMMYQDALLFK
jgi:hypothetical protein